MDMPITVSFNFKEHWMVIRNNRFKADDILKGKYMIFGPTLEVLVGIAMLEVASYGFGVARISMRPRVGDYTLYLYWEDDSRSEELGRRYKRRTDIKYRWWKGPKEPMPKDEI